MSDTTQEFSQGQVLLGQIGNAGLEVIVSGYLTALEQALGALVQAAEGLADDGFGLTDFVGLLKGEDA